ncbi:MAG TPA: homoserine O-acetyltransferase [Geminicoccus sp.]|jgi:homoserine O-acetyltransferase|uniref:homoserine O-acetyltransferase MetX n=1 Tax=Geminicoccus sp. TaxID=2024832 RepID=UPI002E308F3F|nr:homoserine O-acetyltransferase [Geminicoccus sp.]HEX2526087.1 homoserine O-acetyltransferase [Geminicoccus sp.]
MSLNIARHTLAVPGHLDLTGGGRLVDLQVAYESYGTLAPARDNVVLVLHGLTADQHAAGPPWMEGGKAGWWDVVIGPGKPLDTDRFFVICPNVLGGSGGTTGPASTDATGQPYGSRFPVVTIADMVELQRVFLDELGIERVHAAVGGCMGGFQVMEWLARHPQRIGRAVLISATPSTTTHNLALWSVLRTVLQSDPAFRNGDYYDGPAPDTGVGLLAMVGALFWMSRETLQRRFGLRTADGTPPRYTIEPDFAIEHFLHGIRQSAAGRLDANSFIHLTRAIDYFDLSRDHGSIEQAFARATAPALLVSYRSDWRYPPEDIELLHIAMSRAGLPSRHVVLDSPVGHGAFLYDFASLAPILAEFVNSPE